MKHRPLWLSALSLSVLLGGSLTASAYLSDSDASVPEASKTTVETETTATWDYSDKAIMDATMALSGSAAEGTVIAAEDNGVVMTVVANGAAFHDNGNNIQVRSGAEFRIPVQSTEDVVTIKGYPGYSYYKIGENGEEIKNTNDNPETVYKARYSDMERGYVSVISTNDNNYYYSLSVTQLPPRQLAVLDNEPATATFVLDKGEEKQKATFTNADYFLGSKVICGSDVYIDGKDNKSLSMTWFRPKTANVKGPDESNGIFFSIQPKHGLVFTPSKVSFKATRFGTDGGKLDIAWRNVDGTLVTLDTEKTPQRDNASPNVSEYSYEVTGSVPAEGACGLYINLYSLGDTKRIGIKDVVIEGTLTGHEKEVPMLASFTANGVEYIADDIFEADGDSQVTTIELASSETMISAANPITDATPAAGKIGEITYEGDNDHCVATIPTVLKDITINYIVNFVRKPIFTLTYYNTDGSVMGTQGVEKDAKIEQFDCDYATAKCDEGYKVRGWFAQPTVGRKASVEDVILENTSLYAVATEIEEQSNHKKYLFDLTSQYFYPEDHEAFCTENGYWHDKSHGWAFKNGDKIDLLVGPKADISVTLCRYGYGTTISITDAAGTVIGTLPAKSETETDGEVVAFNYEGEGGVITLNFESEGELYIHAVKIVNTTEVNYERDGQWFYVKPGDASSLLDVIEGASAVNASRDAARVYIYVPDGTYDLRDKVLNNISGHNISLIGQSMEGVIIKNAPHRSTEGISTTATLMNTGTNLYMQDLTIQNALDYYGALSDNLAGGRAVAFWDKGTNTICKNVTLLSYQDTYYSNNINGDYYWETSDIHGTVDFLCGEGTMFMNNSTITVEMRNANGKGECTITAPSTGAADTYGYVFYNCEIVNHAEKYNLGRAWSNEPRCAYINTKVSDKALNPKRWTDNGMNVAAKSFVEYNTTDAEGNVVTPESHIMKFYKDKAVNEMETVLTAEQAAEYTLDKVFPAWKPAELATQVAAPAGKIENSVMTWSAVEGANGYAVFVNDMLEAIVDGTSLTLTVNADDNVAIRSINSMGGLGLPAYIQGGSSSIEGPVAEPAVTSTVYYNMQGVKVSESYTGVVIRVDTLSNGKTVRTKLLNR